MDLTQRELDILKFLASGYTNAQIANILGVHYRIINTCLESIWRKLDGESRPAIAVTVGEARVLDRSPVRI